jgi:hypothetical protein
MYFKQRLQVLKSQTVDKSAKGPGGGFGRKNAKKVGKS